MTTTSAWKTLTRPTPPLRVSTVVKNLEVTRSSKMSFSRIYSALFQHASIGHRGMSLKPEAPFSITPDFGSKTYLNLQFQLVKSVSVSSQVKRRRNMTSIELAIISFTFDDCLHKFMDTDRHYCLLFPLLGTKIF